MQTVSIEQPIKLIKHDLVLNGPDIKFAEALLDYHDRNKNHFSPWIQIPEKEFYTLAKQKEILNAQISFQAERRAYKFYISHSNQSERIIGDLSFSNIIWGAFKACHLGYKVDRSECGKGIATKAISGAIQFIFSQLKLHRIEANVIPKNKASIRVLEKCDFKNEGLAEKYLQINGVWEDHLRYYLINPIV